MCFRDAPVEIGKLQPFLSRTRKPAGEFWRNWLLITLAVTTLYLTYDKLHAQSPTRISGTVVRHTIIESHASGGQLADVVYGYQMQLRR